MRKILVALLLVALLAGAMMIMATVSRGSEWTTTSREARAEFEEGLAASMKYYRGDAEAHFRRAVEIDPDFAAAKLYLSSELEWEEREALREELRQVDLETLNPRERFLLEFHRAEWDRDIDRARRMGMAYVAENPEDPFGLATLADLLWLEQDWQESERLYRELLELAPNWVTAQNRLGYTALAQGRFAEAEQQFITYRYIAPDQANPHDSLGELMVLLGRYDEAREAFAKALEIRPDFCDTYQHLIDLALMDGRPGDGQEVLERAAPHCSERMIEALRCSLLIWDDFMRGDSERVWSDERADCRRQMGEYHFLLHRTACETGRLEIAEGAERGLRRRLEAAEEAEHVRLDFIRALLLHMEGTRLLTEKRYQEAALAFQQADEMLLYWGEGQGILKLYNRMNLAWAQEQLGLEAEAAETLAEVSAVNAPFASTYPESVAID
jgi:tetratricopeptide (TPR) repeat protein